jgi:hypothetical protein
MDIVRLLNQIKNDGIVLAAFQRDFVSEEVKIPKLLDSIPRRSGRSRTALGHYHSLRYRTFIKDYRPRL